MGVNRWSGRRKGRGKKTYFFAEGVADHKEPVGLEKLAICIGEFRLRVWVDMRDVHAAYRYEQEDNKEETDHFHSFGAIASLVLQ